MTHKGWCVVKHQTNKTVLNGAFLFLSGIIVEFHDYAHYLNVIVWKKDGHQSHLRMESRQAPNKQTNKS